MQAIRRYLAVQSGGESFEVVPTITADAARLLASAATRGVDVSGGRAPWSGQQTFVLKLIDAQEQVQIGKDGHCRARRTGTGFPGGHGVEMRLFIRAGGHWESGEVAIVASSPRTASPERRREPVGDR